MNEQTTPLNELFHRAANPIYVQSINTTNGENPLIHVINIANNITEEVNKLINSCNEKGYMMESIKVSVLQYPYGNTPKIEGHCAVIRIVGECKQIQIK